MPCKYCGKPCLMSMCKSCYNEYHETDAEMADDREPERDDEEEGDEDDG